VWANHGVRVYVKRGKGLWRKSQDFKPDRGNPAVGHYRGLGKHDASGNVQTPRNRKGGDGNPSTSCVQALSQPQRKRGTNRQANLRSTAPVLDPAFIPF
jgi:hypothetical protein